MNKKSLVIGTIAATALLGIPEIATATSLSTLNSSVELSVDRFGRPSLNGANVSTILHISMNDTTSPKNVGCTQNANCSCTNIVC